MCQFNIREIRLLDRDEQCDWHHFKIFERSVNFLFNVKTERGCVVHTLNRKRNGTGDPPYRWKVQPVLVEEERNEKVFDCPFNY